MSSSMDVDMPDAAASAARPPNDNQNHDDDDDVDMGYEDCAPQIRRGSMTLMQERERRASIKAVMADKNLSPKAKRLSIQHLMDGRRNSVSSGIDGASVHTTITTSSVGSHASPPAMTTFVCLPCTNTTMDTAIVNDQTMRAEQARPPCTHYERWCTMIAPCCGGAFGCRICHDECPDLPPVINNSSRRYQRSASLPSSFTSQVDGDNNHPIDRFAVSEIICRQCFARQSSKTNQCINCGISFGEYHCEVCNLWMSNEEQPYHCPDCGFCRVGGRENFRHCHECGMCIDRTLYDSHNCKAGKYRSNCPVCQEYLFSSRGASHEMPCGHAIHWECFRQLAVHDSRCPVCKKTAETKDRMMPTWNAMAAGIEMQPVPAELSRVVNITCIDCETADYERKWHFLGTQCAHCQSFNTVVDRILLQGEHAHRFLVARQQSQQQSEDGQQQQQPRRRLGRRRSAF